MIKHRPRLAVARADRRQVTFIWGKWDRIAVFSTLAGDLTVLGQNHQSYRRQYPTGLLARAVDMSAQPPGDRVRGYALAPLVPPKALNAISGTAALSRHLILWEVEQWSDRMIGAVPDRDPLLLRPIHGDLCAVVAQWDLTDLERAVMASRVFA